MVMPAFTVNGPDSGVIDGSVTACSVKVCLVVPTLLVAAIVTMKLPVTVGTPLRTPLLPKETPFGRVPLLRANVVPADGFSVVSAVKLLLGVFVKNVVLAA